MPHPHGDPESKHHESDAMFKGLVMGVVVGAGLLWLLGTESGKKVKKQIQAEGEDLLRKVTGNEAEVSEEVQSELEDEIPEEMAPVVRKTPPRKTAIRAATKKPLPKTPNKRFFRRKTS